MSRKANGHKIDVDALTRSTPDTEGIRRTVDGGRPGGNPDLLATRSPKQPYNVETIPTVWKTISSLELRGLSQTQIARELNFSLVGVSQIVRDPAYREYVNRVLGEMDEDFLRMKPLAFKALEGGLKALDQDIALRASAQWFKAAGFGGFGMSGGAGQPKAAASAEEVASRLLNQVNVQVNITTPINSTSERSDDGSIGAEISANHPQRGSGSSS